MSKRKTKQPAGAAKQPPRSAAQAREIQSSQTAAELTEQTPETEGNRLEEATVPPPRSVAQAEAGSRNQPERPARQPGRNQPEFSHKQSGKRQSRYQQKQVEQARAARKRLITFGGIIAASIVILGLLTWAIIANRAAQAQTNNGTSNLANPAVDNILCEAQEQLVYHIHAHVTIWINGEKVQVPQGVGIAQDSSCIYWLHTHAANGVIHIESPSEKVYTVGNFLDIWGGPFQTLQYRSELDQTSGWKVYVNGKPVDGKFRDVPLNAHDVITLAYNSPGIQPDTTYSWANGE
jgi:hypothetical protein